MPDINLNQQKRKHRDELIRYHCEEASTHLGALKQIIPTSSITTAEHRALNKMGKLLASIHHRYGGIKH